MQFRTMILEHGKIHIDKFDGNAVNRLVIGLNITIFAIVFLTP